MTNAQTTNAVIVDAVRTPLGKRNGSLKDWHPVDLAAHTLEALATRNDLDPAVVDDVIMGCVSQAGEQTGNIGRNAVLAAGFPESVPGTSVDRQCGSSQQAIHFAAQGVLAGAYDVVIAAGVESMTRVPMGASLLPGSNMFGPRVTARYDLVPQGISAERIAEKWGITRDENDAYAAQSHQRAARGTDEGRFEREIVPVPVDVEGEATSFARDEGIRPGSTVETLAQLKPAFVPEGGVITAGNSSQITDGAAAVLIMSEERASELGLTPRARFHAFALAGADPVLMLTAPIPATTKVLERAGLSLDDIDRVEINEAFAPVILAWAKEHNPDLERVNVNGGAIALGHPLGCSGARLMATLLNELERTGGRYGLQAMCEGGGLANATIIERLWTAVIVAISWIGWVLRVAIAIVAIVGIYVIGAAVLAKFKVAPPAEPDPDLVVPVDLKFRCAVCGAEVVMTAAQADTEIDAPRHCREDMVIVDD